MKKQLLITTALVSAVVGSGDAIAQTTVTGNMELTYAAKSIKDTSAANTNSRRHFLRETQINVQNKGKLNNGIDYAAGFALEFDGRGSSGGRQTYAIDNSISNENVYLDLIFGNTTLTMGVDHAPRGYASAVPQVYSSIDLAAATGSATSFVIGGGVVESAGFGVNHKFMGLTASAYYAPTLASTGGESINTLTSDINENSAYELGIAGTLANTGLTVKAFTSNSKKKQADMGGDIESITYGVGYNFGKFAIGAEFIEDKNNHSRANVATGTVIAGYSTHTRTERTKYYGVSYNIDKNSSVSLNQFKTELGGSIKAATNGDEKYTTLSYGYNFGPVGLSVSLQKFENTNYVTASSASGDMGIVRVTANF